MSLIAHYPLDDDAGPATDYAGGNDATVNGATYNGGQFLSSGVMSFDGVDDYVDTGMDLTSKSVLAWFRTNDTTTSLKTVYSDAHDGMVRVEGDGTVSAYVSDGAWQSVSTTAAYNDGAWHHAAVTINRGGNLTLYIDGDFIGSTPIGTANTSTQTVQFGREIQDSGISDKHFPGDIANARVYDHMLSEEEVSTLYESALNGYIELGEKQEPSPIQPGITNMQYTLNGQQATIEVRGSPGEPDEEVNTVELTGQLEDTLSWSNAHDTFSAGVYISTTDPATTPEITSFDVVEGVTLASAPTNLTAENTAVEEVTLNWADNNTNETEHTIYRATTSGTTTADYTAIATVGADITTYTDTAVVGGTEYFYRVTATVDATETAPSNEASITALTTEQGTASTWETATDWDRAVSQAGVVHESGGSLPGAATVKLGVSREQSADKLLHVPLDEAAGTTVAQDYSGNNNDGTVTESTFGDAQLFGERVPYFDGNNDHIDIGAVGVSGEQSRTLIAWVWDAGRQKSNYRGIAGFQGWGGDSGEFFDFQKASDNGLVLHNYANALDFAQAGEYEGEWHMLAATYDSDRLQSIYYDGVQITAQSGYILSTIDNVNIAYRSDDGEHWQGRVAHVEVYDRAWSGTEISQRYNSLTNGHITTDWKSHFSGAVDTIALSGVQQTLNGQSITVTVESDTTGDGVVDETSDPITLDGRTEPYSVTGLTTLPSQTRLHIELSTTDITTAPQLSSATVDTDYTQPTSADVTWSDADEATVTWDDNSADETQFTIYRSTTPGTTLADYTQVGTTGADITSYTEVVPDPTAEYYYRVTATTPAGETTPTNEARLEPQYIDLSIVSGDSDSVTLDWNSNVSPDNWYIYRSTVGGAMANYTQVGTVATGTSHTDAIDGGQTYYYRVTAYASTPYESPPSNEESILTPHPEATGVAVGVSGTTATISWTDNALHNAGYRILRSRGQDYEVVVDNLGPDITSATYGFGDELANQYYKVEAYGNGTESLSTETATITGSFDIAYSGPDNPDRMYLYTVNYLLSRDPTTAVQSTGSATEFNNWFGTGTVPEKILTPQSATVGTGYGSVVHESPTRIGYTATEVQSVTGLNPDWYGSAQGPPERVHASVEAITGASSQNHDMTGAGNTYIGAAPDYEAAVTGMNPDWYGVGSVIPTSYFRTVRGRAYDENWEPITGRGKYIVASDNFSVAGQVDEDGYFQMYLLRRNYTKFWLVVEDPEQMSGIDYVWYESQGNPDVTAETLEVDLQFQTSEPRLGGPGQGRGRMNRHMGLGGGMGLQ